MSRDAVLDSEERLCYNSVWRFRTRWRTQRVAGTRSNNNVFVCASYIHVIYRQITLSFLSLVHVFILLLLSDVRLLTLLIHVKHFLILLTLIFHFHFTWPLYSRISDLRSAPEWKCYRANVMWRGTRTMMGMFLNSSRQVTVTNDHTFSVCEIK